MGALEVVAVRLLRWREGRRIETGELNIVEESERGAGGAEGRMILMRKYRGALR